MVAPNQPASPRALSPKKRLANRRNAQKSTGPRTEAGKARSARNRTSHGIFCRDLLLPGEDERMFRRIRESVIQRLRPQDALELMFVDRIVQAQWRLNRCQAAEHLDHDHHAVRVREQAQRDVRRFERRHGTRKDLLDDPQPGDDRLLFELELLERLAATDITSTRGFTLHLALRSTVDRTLERLSGYEQRLERTMHRALLELRHLRGTPPKTWADLPISPYAGRVEEEAEHHDEPNDAGDAKDEAEPAGDADTSAADTGETNISDAPTADAPTGDALTPSPRHSGERAGERGELPVAANPRPIRPSAPSDTPPPARSRASSATSSPRAADPSPHPADHEPNAPAQNEPTAEEPAASTAQATSSTDPTAAPPPDPESAHPIVPLAPAPAPPPRDPPR